MPNQKLNNLFIEQQNTWGLLKESINSLSKLQVKELNIAGDTVKVQFNPLRAVSTLAKTDKASISARPCFLCKENRPSEQHGFFITDDYIVLCNPRPIFPHHFTISKEEHTQQEILGREKAFLEIVRLVGNDNIVFFNGAKAGASAPDHLHFQDCKVDALPLMQKIQNTTFSDTINLISFAGLPFLVLSGTDDEIIPPFREIVAIHYKNYEPGLINVWGYYNQNRYQVTISLRSKHRPDCYFSNDPSKQLLISPASIEMGGVIVTIRKEDFDAITNETASKLLQEVSCSKDYFTSFLPLLRKKGVTFSS